MMVNQVYYNWCRKEGWQKLCSVIRLEMTKKPDYGYHITQLDKGNGETRPLSVPDGVERIRHEKLLHPLQQWLSPWISSSQHGFLSGRGTMTAWQDIIDHVLNSRNIWEYDMKKFFDSINITYLSLVLLSTGVPSHLVEYMERC